MASIWLQNGKQAATKLVGHLPATTASNGALARFKIEVAKAAKGYDADVTYQDDVNALLQPRPKTEGETLVVYAPIAMWVEALSPPSAPEPYQPKLLYSGSDAVDGIVVTKAGAFTLGVPK